MLTYEKPEPGMPVVLTLNGRRLELRYTLRTLKQMQAETGLSILKGNGLGDIVRDPEQLAIMLAYGLRDKQPDCDLAWVEENFDSSLLLSLFPVLAFCMTGTLPDMEKLLKRPNANGSIEPETGSSSGRSADTTSDLPN